MAEEVHRAVEAIVMVAEAPVEPGLLAQLLELPVERVEAICSELALSYEAEDRGFQLQRVAGGYRFASHPDLAAYVERFVLEGQSTRLSSAALETLAIVAYKQPMSRVQVIGHPRRGRRWGPAHPGPAGLRRRGGPRPRPRPGRAVRHHARRSSSASASTPSTICRPLGDFVPGAEVVEALEQGLGCPTRMCSPPDLDLTPGASDAERSTRRERPDA